MAITKVQAVFERASGLPEDRIINTFCVDTAALTMAAASLNIKQRFDTFYAGVSGSQQASLRSYMSRVLIALSYRIYNLGEPEPREATVVASTLWTRPSNVVAALPSEVAVCSSFYASRNLPRQRGRIFLGPLNTTAMQAVTDASVDTQPEPDLRQALADATKGLNAGLTTDGLRLCVFSVADQVARGVTNGWVDNAFDTQRRRGGAAAQRTLWAA